MLLLDVDASLGRASSGSWSYTTRGGTRELVALLGPCPSLSLSSKLGHSSLESASRANPAAGHFNGGPVERKAGISIVSSPVFRGLNIGGMAAGMSNDTVTSRPDGRLSRSCLRPINVALRRTAPVTESVAPSLPDPVPGPVPCPVPDPVPVPVPDPVPDPVFLSIQVADTRTLQPFTIIRIKLAPLIS